jgi:hypothetical protein
VAGLAVGEDDRVQGDCRRLPVGESCRSPGRQWGSKRKGAFDVLGAVGPRCCASSWEGNHPQHGPCSQHRRHGESSHDSLLNSCQRVRGRAGAAT